MCLVEDAPGEELVDVEGFRAWYALLHAHTRVLADLERRLLAETGLTLTAYEVLGRTCSGSSPIASMIAAA